MPLFKSGHDHYQVRKKDQGMYEIDGSEHKIQITPLNAHQYLVQSNHKQSQLHTFQSGPKTQVWYQGEYYELQPQTRQSAAHEDQLSNTILAPLTGKVIEVPVVVGAEVEKGFALVILESMKMETSLTAPAKAKVVSVNCKAGEQVTPGQLLIELEFQEES